MLVQFSCLQLRLPRRHWYVEIIFFFSSRLSLFLKALPRKFPIGGPALLVAENGFLKIRAICKIFSLSSRTLIPTNCLLLLYFNSKDLLSLCYFSPLAIFTVIIKLSTFPKNDLKAITTGTGWELDGKNKVGIIGIWILNEILQTI